MTGRLPDAGLMWRFVVTGLSFLALVIGQACGVDRKAGESCFGAYECTPGLYCRDGRCADPKDMGCQSNVQCGVGNVCRFNACVAVVALTPCDNLRPCSVGDCKQGYCARDGEGTGCRIHEDCTAGLVCESTVCRPGTRCGETSECRDDEFCDRGRCVERPSDQECETTDDCTGDEICMSGRCTT